MKRTLIILIIALSFVACGKKEKEKTKIEKKIKFVKTSSVLENEMSKRILASSELEPLSEVVHMADNGGDIEGIYLNNGRFVKAGETILKLSNTKVESTFLQAEANYLAAKSRYERKKEFSEAEYRSTLVQKEVGLINAKMNLKTVLKGAKQEEIDQSKLALSSAKKNYEVTKKNYDKNKKLYEKKLISESTFLNLENALSSAENNYKTSEKRLKLIQDGADEEDINILKANVKNAQDTYDLMSKKIDQEIWKYDIRDTESSYLSSKAVYKLAKKNNDDLVVKAKISGLITDLDLYKKANVDSGKKLFTIVNNKQMIMKVGIDDKNIKGVQDFNDVEIYVEALAKKYKGKIYQVNPSADKITKKFEIRIKIDNKTGELKKGMYAKSEIISGEHTAVVVPKQAVIFTGLDAYVFKIEGNVAKKIEVILGQENSKFSEVITNEIKLGDKVAIEGQFLLNDKDKVSEEAK